MRDKYKHAALYDIENMIEILPNSFRIDISNLYRTTFQTDFEKVTFQKKQANSTLTNNL